MARPLYAADGMGVDPVYRVVDGRKMCLGYRVVRWVLVPGQSAGSAVFRVVVLSAIYPTASRAARAFADITGKSLA